LPLLASASAGVTTTMSERCTTELSATRRPLDTDEDAAARLAAPDVLARALQASRKDTLARFAACEHALIDLQVPQRETLNPPLWNWGTSAGSRSSGSRAIRSGTKERAPIRRTARARCP